MSKTSFFHASAAVLASALLLAPVSQAHADPVNADPDHGDYKTFSAMSCVPTQPNTSLNELQYINNSLYNSTDAPRTIICPLMLDTNGTWDGNQRLLYVFKTGNVPGRVSCLVRIGGAGYADPYKNYAAVPKVQPANTHSSGEFFNLSDGGWDWGVHDYLGYRRPATLQCSLDPRTQFSGWVIREGAETGTLDFYEPPGF